VQHIDQAVDPQRRQRLAQRGPRDPELAGEFALGRQAIAGVEAASDRQFAYLRGRPGRGSAMLTVSRMLTRDPYS
jgi:hypothetical protein